jgi:hypothetical protein
MNAYFIINIFFLFLGATIINNDFKSSKGFLKQKIFHVIALSLLIFNHTNSFKWFFFLINHYSEYYSKWFIQAGIIPPIISFVFNIFDIVLGVVLFVCSWVMLTRNDKYRNIVIKILPFKIIVSLPTLYMDYNQATTPVDKMSHLIGGSLFILTFIGICFLYRSKFMREFFDEKKKQVLPPPKKRKIPADKQSDLHVLR